MNHKEIIDLKSKIRTALVKWRYEIEEIPYEKEIIAINFGAVKTLSGYELYLSGHTWFDGHDL